MSVYRVIDVIGTSTTSWRRLPLTRSGKRALRFGTFGSPRSSSRIFTSATVASSSTARGSNCPSGTSSVAGLSATDRSSSVGSHHRQHRSQTTLRGRSRMITYPCATSGSSAPSRTHVATDHKAGLVRASRPCVCAPRLDESTACSRRPPSWWGLANASRSTDERPAPSRGDVRRRSPRSPWRRWPPARGPGMSPLRCRSRRPARRRARPAARPPRDPRAATHWSPTPHRPRSPRTCPVTRPSTRSGGAAGLSSAARPPLCCSRRATRSAAGSRASTSTWRGRSRRPSSATPDKIQRRVVTNAERIPVLQDGSVDLVISVMTINCDRWQQIAFSAEYYRAGQKVLVQRGSNSDLAG